MDKGISAFLFFHCNLAFSSIKEDERGKVISNCYDPLLDLAENGIAIGIEATAWTLEVINSLRPDWIERLKSLLAENKTEFIGSGYAQSIAPLLPWKVNLLNQELGQELYQELIGQKPKLALVNEQAFSSGIAEIYSRSSYEAIIMEWDNAALAHPEWPEKLRYYPHEIKSAGGSLGILWNQSEIFQQLQRYAHRELELEDYLSFCGKFITGKSGALCLYGNDAEIFNFRPGRFETEADLHKDEWARIAEALLALKERYNIFFLLPSQIRYKYPPLMQGLELTTPKWPVIVKKQPKYNLLRWAVTGRNDGVINARSRFLAEQILSEAETDKDRKKLVCELFASDYRTHITEERWQAYLDKLSHLEEAYAEKRANEIQSEGRFSLVSKQNRYLELEKGSTRLVLDTSKGLVIEQATFLEVSPFPLFGTLRHGYYNDISLAADFFTGHCVMEIPGEKRYTDLEKCSPWIRENPDSITVRTEINKFYCRMEKSVSILSGHNSLELNWRLFWEKLPKSSLRILHLTLNPESFDSESLYYASHNGGQNWEVFPLNEDLNHGQPVSFSISASCAVGMSEGRLRIGDREKYAEIVEERQNSGKLVALISYRKIKNSFLARVALSIREYDDTARFIKGIEPQNIKININAYKSEEFHNGNKYNRPRNDLDSSFACRLGRLP